ncbi:unnamed protein product [Ectocarpus fasciculatus]
MNSLLTLLSVSAALPAAAFTPYTPTSGWTYHVEAAREGVWPSCAYRFLSYDSGCSSVDLWKAAGGNQEWTLQDAGGGSFYLKTSCGKYLSYSGDCDAHVLDLWAEAGGNQKFNFVKGNNGDFEWYLEAAGRASCAYRWASFPVPCTTSSPDSIDLWKDAGTDQRFRIHPVRNSKNPLVHSMNAGFGCADPFVWWSDEAAAYRLQCTGGMLPLAETTKLSSEASFSKLGNSLGGSPPSWASNSNRWAPENFEVDGVDYVFFSDAQSDGVHRIGWAASSTGPEPSTYTTYASSYMSLGGAPGGDIDQTIFTDDNGKTYIVWKTDDNAVGSTSTRIFAQQISFGNYSVSLVGDRKQIMDSTGLWWVDSWVSGGSLVEGPEILKLNGWYYLFFASGKYCQDSYAEGVARSSSIWGPYDKLEVPLLATGVVGNAASNGAKLVGPGHASVAEDHSSKGTYWVVYHASAGENCDRYPFVDKLKFTDDGWPFVAF